MLTMKSILSFLLVPIIPFALTLAACGGNIKADKPESETKPIEKETFEPINPKGNTVMTRFNTPEGYKRESLDSNSFGAFLQHLPLKTDGSPLYTYTGNLKPNQSTPLAVVDWPIYGCQNHQCADAVMRLRAQYLFDQKRYNEISFSIGRQSKTNYIQWLNGKTPTAENLWKHLLYVFAVAGTASLENQLIQKDIKDLEIGDVFIKGGYPGHVVIIVDKCINSEGKVKFMIAQSYMPAQEIEILNGQEDGNPWYDADFGENLITPEYPFLKNQLKSFE
jgi:hypothetical protein